MSDILQHRGRRAAEGAADPLDALPPTAASEIVRAARWGRAGQLSPVRYFPW